MAKNFSTERRQSPKEDYLKVFLAKQETVNPVASFLGRVDSVRKCNVTHSDGKAHPGDTLTVYKKPMFDISELERDVIEALSCYFSHVIIVPEQKINEASFSTIRNTIIAQLNKALNTIFVCMAWFTEVKFLEVLEQKRKEGIEIRIIIFKDGINKTKGVDLSNFEHKEIRAEHGGIMHNKYIIVDNHVVITGSYNWSANAELRNEENVAIIQDWEMANRYTRQFFDLWNMAKIMR